MQQAYDSTQLFVNYLLENESTDPVFKEKIKTRQSLKFYMMEYDKKKLDASLNNNLRSMKYLLKPI